MFVKTFKTSKAELIVLLIGLLCFIATLWYILSPKTGTSRTMSNSVTSVSHFLVNAQTASDREQFLAQFGWEVRPDPIEAREITVPATFDEVYAAYNGMQKKLGFDLEQYRGCRVKKWVYEVTNYPGISDNVTATLLIADGRVIGGHIASGGAQKFTHSLLLPPEMAGKEVSRTDALSSANA